MIVYMYSVRTIRTEEEKTMIHILYNPKASNGQGLNKANELRTLLQNEALTFHNVLEIASMPAFFDTLPEDDVVYLAGGDGTLNKFVNLMGDAPVRQELYLYGAGSGNDFLHDVLDVAGSGPARINDYIVGLPTVTVNGKTYRFINGIGYGIDGYCCEVGDKMQAENPGKKVNYAGIAIKGLLFHFRPTNATVTVDGVAKTYRKVWLAPTMNGRYYGGGMNIAPAQDRLNAERTVSSVVLYGSGKIKTLMVFPSIFEGKHVSHTEMVDIREGHTITVSFDRPTALQIDGETVLGVTEYTVTAAGAPRKEEAPAEEVPAV